VNNVITPIFEETPERMKVSPDGNVVVSFRRLLEKLGALRGGMSILVDADHTPCNWWFIDRHRALLSQFHGIISNENKSIIRNILSKYIKKLQKGVHK